MIKRYNQFIKENIDIEPLIEDIFAELKDLGFMIYINVFTNKINIAIHADSNHTLISDCKTFKMSQIKDELIMLNGIMQDINYNSLFATYRVIAKEKLVKSTVHRQSNIVNNVDITGDDYMDFIECRDSFSNLNNSDFIVINITFGLNQKGKDERSFNESTKFDYKNLVNDTLSNLKDDGYNININTACVLTKHPTRSENGILENSYHVYITKKPDFMYSDISSDIDALISYSKEHEAILKKVYHRVYINGITNYKTIMLSDLNKNPTFKLNCICFEFIIKSLYPKIGFEYNAPISESKEENEIDLDFIKQPKKKDAKTDTYKVVKDGNTIGLIKWSSRMRGYAFLPTSDCEQEIKSFVKDLMVKRRLAK